MKNQKDICEYILNAGSVFVPTLYLFNNETLRGLTNVFDFLVEEKMTRYSL